jgi:hypothetical protein
MKKINILMLVIASIVFTFLLIPAFLGTGAVEDGTAEDNLLAIALSKLFLILRFPTHTLFWSTISDNVVLYFLGLIFNCALYGFIIERIFSTFKIMKPVEVQ